MMFFPLDQSGIDFWALAFVVGKTFADAAMSRLVRSAWGLERKTSFVMPRNAAWPLPAL